MIILRLYILVYNTTDSAFHAEYCGFLMNMEPMLNKRMQAIIIGARNRHVICQ